MAPLSGRLALVIQPHGTPSHSLLHCFAFFSSLHFSRNQTHLFIYLLLVSGVQHMIPQFSIPHSSMLTVISVVTIYHHTTL